MTLSNTISRETDVVVVGAGIVGLATARALLREHPRRRVTVVDKEAEVAAHQSGHNSGVLHSGIYYRPGSLKANLCVQGRAELEACCAAWGVPWERCGKVIVATRPGELDGLHMLLERGRANGVEATPLDRRGLAEHEPHADGVGALFVPATGVVDYARVCRELAADLVAAGGRLCLERAVLGLDEHTDHVRVTTSDGPIRAGALVNCAGLHSDKVALAGGSNVPVQIMPFRGEYFELVESRRHLVRHLIYPVPDPRFPFLGVHFTRGIDGHVHAGPNAVPALGRESYRWRTLDVGDVSAMVRAPATRRLARRYWRTGIAELDRSLRRSHFLRDLRRLVPDVGDGDLVRAGAGVRAQAVAPDGSLVDDFALVETARCVHVVNAPSPAATASIAIGRAVAERVERLGRPHPGP